MWVQGVVRGREEPVEVSAASLPACTPPKSAELAAGTHSYIFARDGGTAATNTTACQLLAPGSCAHAVVDALCAKSMSAAGEQHKGSAAAFCRVAGLAAVVLRQRLRLLAHASIHNGVSAALLLQKDPLRTRQENCEKPKTTAQRSSTSLARACSTRLADD